jgi:hypothetical protein
VGVDVFVRVGAGAGRASHCFVAGYGIFVYGLQQWCCTTAWAGPYWVGGVAACRQLWAAHEDMVKNTVLNTSLPIFCCLSTSRCLTAPPWLALGALALGECNTTAPSPLPCGGLAPYLGCTIVVSDHTHTQTSPPPPPPHPHPHPHPHPYMHAYRRFDAVRVRPALGRWMLRGPPPPRRPSQCSHIDHGGDGAHGLVRLCVWP